MTDAGYRVLEAVARAERASPSPYLPLKRIALAALGGDADLAARTLAALDLEGYVRTDTMGWQWGWLTAKGHRVLHTAA